MRKINVMLFDKAQKIFENYQIENDLANMDITINNLLEEFDRCKRFKKKKEEEKEKVEVGFVELDSQEKK